MKIFCGKNIFCYLIVKTLANISYRDLSIQNLGGLSARLVTEPSVQHKFFFLFFKIILQNHITDQIILFQIDE